MKKIITVEVNGSSENPEEIIRNLFKREKNVSTRPVNGQISHVYSIGGQKDNVNKFIILLKREFGIYGIEIISIKEIRNNNPIDLDAVHIKAVSIIPT